MYKTILPTCAVYTQSGMTYIHMLCFIIKRRPNMIKQISILLISILSSFYCIGQEFEKVVINDIDSSNLYINDNDSTELYYLKLVPKSKPIGAVVIFPSGGETTQDLLKQIEIPR